MRILATYSNANLSASAAVQILSPDGTGAAFAQPGSQRSLLIAASGQPVWVKLTRGDVAAATKGTASELLVVAGQPLVIDLSGDWDGLSIIANGSTCLVSVSLVG